MALTECRECGARVSNKAKTCPECGIDRPGQEWGESEKQGCIGCFGAIVVLSVFLVLFSDSGSDSTSSSTSSSRTQITTITSGSPPEAKLASIDRQSTRVPTRVVRQYGRLLDRLDRKCQEPRVRISDMAVKGVQLLEEDKGVIMSNREMLEAVDGSMPKGSESLNLKCAEIVASLVTMIDRR